MTVSRNFSELNAIARKDYGYVVGIELVDLFPVVWNDHRIGFSKRKSCHVPASSNAYWNYMNLRSQVVAWWSRKGIVRRDRLAIEVALNELVRLCHRETIETDNDVQFFCVSVNAVEEGVELVVWYNKIDGGFSYCHYDTAPNGAVTRICELKRMASIFVNHDHIVAITDLTEADSTYVEFAEVKLLNALVGEMP